MSSESLVYRSVLGYEAVMFSLYGRQFRARHEAVAEFVPAGATVVDLCCGPGRLFDHLRDRGVDYLGVDINSRFLDYVRRRGGRAERRDLHDGAPLPRGDVLVIQASLYHFLPRAQAMVSRMLEAAAARVIVSEPIRNLSDSRMPGIRCLARRQTRPGTGGSAARFTSGSLAACMQNFEDLIESRFPLPGGREHVYVLRTGGDT